MSDNRITEEEKAQILLIAGVDKINNTKVTRDQAVEIARLLNESERLDELFSRNSEDNFELNLLINSLRFYRVLDIIHKNEFGGLSRHAKNIATETMHNAVTEEDRARGLREMNAAYSLGRGDIGGAFRSLNYFQDR